MRRAAGIGLHDGVGADVRVGFQLPWKGSVHMTLTTLARLALGRTASARGIACLGLALVLASAAASAQQSPARASGKPLFTVLNPTGIAPPIDLKPMAERPASLDGKTVYLVDITFNGGDLLLRQMQRWMAANLPDVKTEFRVKKGGYGTDDPELWKEIQAADGLMIMAIGH